MLITPRLARIEEKRYSLTAVENTNRYKHLGKLLASRKLQLCTFSQLGFRPPPQKRSRVYIQRHLQRHTPQRCLHNKITPPLCSHRLQKQQSVCTREYKVDVKTAKTDQHGRNLTTDHLAGESKLQNNGIGFI